LRNDEMAEARGERWPRVRALAQPQAETVAIDATKHTPSSTLDGFFGCLLQSFLVRATGGQQLYLSWHQQ
jgi:hypothetical protein